MNSRISFIQFSNRTATYICQSTQFMFILKAVEIHMHRLPHKDVTAVTVFFPSRASQENH